MQWIRIALAVGFVVLVVLLILYVIGLLFGITLLNLLSGPIRNFLDASHGHAATDEDMSG